MQHRLGYVSGKDGQLGKLNSVEFEDDLKWDLQQVTAVISLKS